MDHSYALHTLIGMTVLEITRSFRTILVGEASIRIIATLAEVARGNLMCGQLKRLAARLIYIASLYRTE